MSRLPSWIIVAAVGAVIVLAAADALRSNGERSPKASAGARAAASSDLHGLIVVGPSCSSLRVLRLPNLIEFRAPRQTDCESIVWSDDGTLYATCADGSTTVGTSEGRRIARLAGCAPAWRPDGALSVIRDGDLVVSRRHGRPRVLVSHDDVADALKGALEGARTYRLVDVAWLGTQAFFGIVAGSRPWQRAIVAYAPEGIDDVFPELGQSISDVRVSPGGTFLAFARDEPGREMVVLDPSGKRVPSPPIANARGIAWSPDESWVAVSTRTTTFIARAGTKRVVFEVPAGGESLSWLP